MAYLYPEEMEYDRDLERCRADIAERNVARQQAALIAIIDRCAETMISGDREAAMLASHIAGIAREALRG